MSHQCRHEICKKSNPRFAKASSRDRHEQSEALHEECWVSLGMVQRCPACTLWGRSGKMRKKKKPKGSHLCGHAMCNERYAHKSSRDFHQRQESHPLCFPQNICVLCQAKHATVVIEEENRTKRSDNEEVDKLALQLMEEINTDASTQTEQTESLRCENYSLTGLHLPTSTMETEALPSVMDEGGGFNVGPFETNEPVIVPDAFCEQIRSEIISDLVTTSNPQPNTAVDTLVDEMDMMGIVGIEEDDFNIEEWLIDTSTTPTTATTDSSFSFSSSLYYNNASSMPPYPGSPSLM